MSVAMLGLTSPSSRRHLRLLHSEATREIALGEVVLRAVSNDRDRDRPRQSCPFPLNAKVRIRAQLVGGELVVGLHVSGLHRSLAAFADLRLLER
jgi:hypothetical protein